MEVTSSDTGVRCLAAAAATILATRAPPVYRTVVEHKWAKNSSTWL